MNKLYFLLCIHNHQPVGNFESVIEEAYNKAYKPFIDLLFEYPKIKFSLHCSGILWDYFKDKHPEYIEKVKEMVKRKQVEIFSGGYYEPILSAILQKDRYGQIMMMNEFIFKTFDIEPKGLWLTERVWEQNIVKDIAECGLKYTLVDDYIFYMAGINRLENPVLTDYYLTEEEGRSLYVFPILQTLRYYIPFKSVEENIIFFSNFKDNLSTPVSVTMGDDGEKFGVWPKTYEHVYENKWLRNFLEKIVENNEWLETLTFSEFIELKPPKDRIYLPTASYFEMGEWTLPTSTQMLFEKLIKEIESISNKEVLKQFIHGGYWKNFLSKYPEANNMHKKMINLSVELKKTKKTLIKKLYKAQCNCAYWHGVFGGLYLPHLREAVYENLIDVEKEILKEGIYVKDFDIDTHDEICVSTKNIISYIKPSYGGCIYEIDLKNYNKNLLNVLSRKKEAYHHRLLEFEKNNFKNNIEDVKTIHDIVLTKEKNLSEKIYYDWHNRYSFLDHFLDKDITIEDFYKARYKDLGDFTLESYKVNNIDKESFEVELSRVGCIFKDIKYKIEVQKKYFFKDDSITCKYVIKNISSKDLSSLCFLVEFNFLIFGDSQQEIKEEVTNKLEFKDNIKHFKIEVLSPYDIKFWRFPIETISLSEAGFERNYQGVCIGCRFEFEVLPLQSYHTEITLKVK
ncbi:MAG: alpha-amylase/4-alpha-glucanotransferase domain-containing protein [Endomicrobiia bacterium]